MLPVVFRQIDYAKTIHLSAHTGDLAYKQLPTFPIQAIIPHNIDLELIYILKKCGASPKIEPLLHLLDSEELIPMFSYQR